MFSTQCMRLAWRSTKRLKVSQPCRTFASTGPLREEQKPPVPGQVENPVSFTPARPVEKPEQPEPAAAADAAINPAEGKQAAPDAQSQKQPVTEWGERMEEITEKFRLPRNAQAVYLKPLQRPYEYGLPVCDLQLRSYSVRHVEFFADFAMRAAYYLKLPASGPVPLPRITERWTMPKGHFVHAKTKENFERITLRRLIQIKDGHPDVVQAWLAFLRKHAFYGVGMKANVFEHASIGVGKSMDKARMDVSSALSSTMKRFGRVKGQTNTWGDTKSVPKILEDERYTHTQSPLTHVRK